jgi:hypothetical protein
MKLKLSFYEFLGSRLGLPGLVGCHLPASVAAA